MPTPTLTPVNSSNLAAVGHDGADLYVQFKDKSGAPGKTYRYPGMDKAHLDGMLAAPSPGSYFHNNVKLSNIAGVPVE